MKIKSFFAGFLICGAAIAAASSINLGDADYRDVANIKGANLSWEDAARSSAMSSAIAIYNLNHPTDKITPGHIINFGYSDGTHESGYVGSSASSAGTIPVSDCDLSSCPKYRPPGPKPV